MSSEMLAIYLIAGLMAVAIVAVVAWTYLDSWLRSREWRRKQNLLISGKATWWCGACEMDIDRGFCAYHGDAYVEFLEEN